MCSRGAKFLPAEWTIASVGWHYENPTNHDGLVHCGNHHSIKIAHAIAMIYHQTCSFDVKQQ